MTMRADSDRGSETIAGGETCDAPAQPPEGLGQLPVLAERVGQAREAGDRGHDGGQQDQRAGDADVDTAGMSPSRTGSSTPIRSATPRSGEWTQRVPSAVFGPGNADTATRAIRT